MEPEKTGKAYETVIDYIKKQILSGSLQKGRKLPPERELAERLGVSRNSVREALRTLEILGAVTSTQGAGNYIACDFQRSLFESMSLMFLLQEIDYRQLSELRRALERQAVSLAAGRVTARQLGEMESAVAALAVGRDEARNVVLDKRLHTLIAEASGNRLICLILQALSDVMDLFIEDLRRQILSDTAGGSRLQKIHESMVDCLRHGDREGACRAVDAHFALVDQQLMAAEIDKN